ncbi:MAG: hypothetical protein HQL52_09905 [Magnetococcales bacterium]|nr:hypothetical protein [Magnetococcales bacterium]
MKAIVMKTIVQVGVIGLLTIILVACKSVEAPPPLPLEKIPPLPASVSERYQQGEKQLAKGDLPGTIAAWQEILPQLTNHPIAPHLRGWLTLLRREEAKRYAREAAASEKNLSNTPPNARVIAVLPFSNIFTSAAFGGASKPKPFNQALAAFVMADLSRVPELQIVERDKMQFLLDELALSSSGLTDPATRLRVGRIMGAGHVVTGQVSTFVSGSDYTDSEYAINTVVADVIAEEVRGVQEAVGGLLKFYELEKEIVYEILADLEIKTFPKSVKKIHTKNWDAYAAFALGLEYLSKDRFEEAREAFFKAIHFDPEFELAREAYDSVPVGGNRVSEIPVSLSPKIQGE